MSDLLALWISVAALAAGVVCRPHRARCPDGWYDYDGVRRTGDFTCAPTPTGPDWEPMRPDLGVQPTPRLSGRVWCGAAEQPISEYDGRTITCARR